MQTRRPRPEHAFASHGRRTAPALAVAAAALAAASAALAASGSLPEAHATPACTVIDAEKVWRAYDDIYTGRVASIEGAQGPRPVDSVAGAAAAAAGRGVGGGEEESVRVHFEVARTLKGAPERASWHVDMPAQTRCAGGFCSAGADQYLPGTEVFQLGGFNGMHSPASGACGIGSPEAGTRIGVPGMVFSYYRSLYGFSPPRDDPCGDPAHILVVRERDGGWRDGAACVRPSTAERLGWEPFDRDEWGRSHAPPPPEYDLPIVRNARAERGPDGAAFAISASRLPAVGETAVVTATYAGGIEGGPGRGEPYAAGLYISPNLEFVGLEGAVPRRSHHPDGQGHLYAFEIPPGEGGAPHSFSATVRAASEGYAEIAYSGDRHSAAIELHVGRAAGLLVDDYHRASAPLPDMSGFRDAWSKGGGLGGAQFAALPPAK